MTLDSTKPTITITGNGSTTVFTYPFFSKDKDTIVVTVTDRAVTPYASTTIDPALYTVDVEAGTVTYPLTGSPLPATKTITIQRIIPLEQQTDFLNQSSYYIENTETAFDYNMMAIQQLDAKVDRAVVLPLGSTQTGEEFLQAYKDASDQIAVATSTLPKALFNDVVAFTDPATVTLDGTHNGKLLRIKTPSLGTVVTLPDMNSVTLPYQVAIFRDTGSTGGLVVSRSASDTIQGATTFSISSIGNTVVFVADLVGGTAHDWTPVSMGGTPLASVGTTQLVDNAVTFSKFQQVNACNLIGNFSTSAGNISQLPLNTTSVYARGAGGIRSYTLNASNFTFDDTNNIISTAGSSIADNSLTLAKLAQQTATTVLCNNTTSTANVNALALSTSSVLGRGAGGIRSYAMGAGFSFDDTGNILNYVVPSATITSAMIVDATITGSDIATGTITSGNILDGTITGTDIASGTVTSSNILDGTITGTDIATGTVALTNLATQGANTILANATGSSASPTAVTINASSLVGRGASGNITNITLDTTAFQLISGGLYNSIPMMVPGGRLTVSSSLAVPDIGSTDPTGYDDGGTGVTTIYYLPWLHNRIALYDTTNSIWRIVSFTSVSASTSGLTSGNVYDVFAQWTGSTSTFNLVFSAWSSQSSRGAGSPLVQQDGVYVASGSADKRYLGTLFASTSGQILDNKRQRYLWNFYNQVSRPFTAFDTSAVSSWTYSTATWRQSNATTTNRFETVVGFDVNSFNASFCQRVAGSTSSYAAIGIGRSATAPDFSASTAASTTAATSLTVNYHGKIGLGLRYLYMLEIGSGTAGTFYTTSGGGIGTNPWQGMTGNFLM